jgi:hypothetical protein
VEECGPCPVFASLTLACALQLRKKHGKTSVRLRKTSVRLRETSVRVQYTYYQNTHTLPKHPHITKTPTHDQNTHTLPKHPHITKTPTHTCFSTICEKHQLKKPAGFSLNLYSHTACQSHTVTGPSAPSVSNALCQPCVLLRTAGNIKVRGLGVLQWHCVQPSLC